MRLENLNIVLGIGEDDELYILDDIFHDSDKWQGVTCYSMRHLSDEDIEERNEIDNVMDYCEDLWRMAVRDGHTEEGLREWAAEYASDCYGDLYPGWDGSFYQDTQEAIDKLPRNQQVDLYKYYDQDDICDEFTCECGGCGRHFPKDNKWKMKFVSDELLDMLARIDNTDYHEDFDKLKTLLAQYDSALF